MKKSLLITSALLSFLTTLFASTVPNGHLMVDMGKYSIGEDVVSSVQYVNFLNAIRGNILETVANEEGDKFIGVKIPNINPVSYTDNGVTVNYGNVIGIYNLEKSVNVERGADGLFFAETGVNEKDEIIGISAVGAAMYCNWLTNGAKTTITSANDYLKGAYDFTKGGDLIDVFANVDKTNGYFLPSADDLEDAITKSIVDFDREIYVEGYGSSEITGDIADPNKFMYADENSLVTLFPNDKLNNDPLGILYLHSEEIWECDSNAEFRICTTSSVPEPAEWAVIFGAIAFGFIIYRKRH